MKLYKIYYTKKSLSLVFHCQFPDLSEHLYKIGQFYYCVYVQ